HRALARRQHPGVVQTAPGFDLHSASADPVRRGRPRHPRGRGTDRMTRILIIEDEDSYREALAFMLRKEGFDVSSAPDGAAGLAEFDATGADLVLLDLMMPGMPGMEVCRQLRQRGNVAI